MAGIQIGHSNDHRAREGAFLRSLLEIGHGLHNGDPAASAGEQHGRWASTACLTTRPGG